ncbi:methylenetetrahydrofolate reductase [Kineococcus sp. LSe6-4]|uniref:Methylenetetrahydrofolate reductase n=2 Tax=Kineococcus halophytocola TaxID=3234027 RepID=A0ABV4GX80_9ACTN
MKARRGGPRVDLSRAVRDVGYEVIPFKKTADAVRAHVPRDVSLTVTASPAKGQDATIDLAERLAADGYTVTPHLSAQLVRDRVHLQDVVARCRAAGVRSVFVVGGDRTETPGPFPDALALLREVHDVGHGFTRIGVGGHPEGHPSVGPDVLLQALRAKAALATHITTQIVFDHEVILRWARDVKRQGIDLPVHVGVPGAVTRQKLLRVCGGLGIGESAKFLAKQQKMFWRFFVPGGYHPGRIIKGLVPHLGRDDNNLAGFHVFTFNDLEPTEQWRQRVGSLGG